MSNYIFYYCTNEQCELEDVVVFNPWKRPERDVKCKKCGNDMAYSVWNESKMMAGYND